MITREEHIGYTMTEESWKIFSEVVFATTGKELTVDELFDVFCSIPFPIKCDVISVGMTDIEVKDEVYSYFTKKE